MPSAPEDTIYLELNSYSDSLSAQTLAEKHYIMYIFLYQCSKDKLLLFLLKESQNICEEQRMNICKREKETLGMELNTLMTKEIETHVSRTSQSARGGSTGQC